MRQRMGVLVVCGLIAAGVPTIAQGIQFEPGALGVFEMLTPAALLTLEVRVDYLGPQLESVPPLVLGTMATTAPPARGVPPERLVLSREELQATVRAVRQALDHQHALSRKPLLRVTVSLPPEQTVPPFVMSLDQHDSRAFFIDLHDVLAHNETAQRALQSWSCAFELLPQNACAQTVPVPPAGPSRR